MLELEIEIQEAKERLRNAQDELAQESSKDSSQSISGSNRSRNCPIQDGKEVRHSRVSDENIRQVVCDLHEYSQHDGETQEVFQACKNASARIRRNSEAVGIYRNQNSSQGMIFWTTYRNYMQNRKNMTPNKFDVIRTARMPAVLPNVSETSC